MLHKETVEGATFELLTELMHDPCMDAFNLAGGTALALYMGHRKSVDLDLFTPDTFDTDELEKHLTDRYGLRTTFKRGYTLKGYIGEVIIDCIRYDYPYIKPVFASSEGIRLYSLQDIAAMKLSAIADNGTRLKDFIDIAYLSTLLSLSDMLQAYEMKYPNSTRIRALKGLTYHVDVDFAEPIMLMKGNYEWDAVVKRLADMIQSSETVYKSFPVSERLKVKSLKSVKKPSNRKL